jgi:hypothetical protein
VQRLAGNGGYKVENPHVKMNAAIEAEATTVQRLEMSNGVDELSISASEFDMIDSQGSIINDQNMFPTKDETKIIDQFNKNKADPAKDVLGAGKKYYKDEWDRIIIEFKEAGGDLLERVENYGYSPMKNRAGQIIIDPDASITALMHEYQHYLDNKELGFPGQQVLYSDMEMRIELERRAYMAEIEYLHKLGYYEVENLLWENFEDEVKKIRGFFLGE